MNLVVFCLTMHYQTHWPCVTAHSLIICFLFESFYQFMVVLKLPLVSFWNWLIGSEMCEIMLPSWLSFGYFLALGFLNRQLVKWRTVGNLILIKFIMCQGRCKSPEQKFIPQLQVQGWTWDAYPLSLIQPQRFLLCLHVGTLLYWTLFCCHLFLLLYHQVAHQPWKK